MQLYVFGLVHHAHAAAAELLDNAIVRDGLANHSRESYVCETGKSMKAVELVDSETIVGEKSRFHSLTPATGGFECNGLMTVNNRVTST